MSSFVQKLTDKGWKYNAERSADASTNALFFEGSYFGRKATLIISPYANTDTVESVFVSIPTNSLSELKVLANELSDAFQKKYHVREAPTNIVIEGNPFIQIDVADINTSTLLGNIVIFQSIRHFEPYLEVMFMDEYFYKKSLEKKYDL